MMALTEGISDVAYIDVAFQQLERRIREKGEEHLRRITAYEDALQSLDSETAEICNQRNKVNGNLEMLAEKRTRTVQFSAAFKNEKDSAGTKEGYVDTGIGEVHQAVPQEHTEYKTIESHVQALQDEKRFQEESGSQSEKDIADAESLLGVISAEVTAFQEELSGLSDREKAYAVMKRVYQQLSDKTKQDLQDEVYKKDDNGGNEPPRRHRAPWTTQPASQPAGGPIGGSSINARSSPAQPRYQITSADEKPANNHYIPPQGGRGILRIFRRHSQESPVSDKGKK